MEGFFHILFNFLSLLFLTSRIMTLRIFCNGGVLVSCYWYNPLEAWFIVIPFVYNIDGLDLIALRSHMLENIHTLIDQNYFASPIKLT